MKINPHSDKNILTVAKIGEIAQYSLIHKFTGGNEYESVTNYQKKVPIKDNVSSFVQSPPSNDNFLQKDNQTNNDSSFSVKRLFSTFYNSIMFEGILVLTQVSL